MDLRAGDLFDHYVIESVIGRGGMGVVYLARDDRLGRRVALKVLAPELAEDPSFRARFQDEARTAASLDEAHVVPIYEAGDVGGQLFLAMRFVQGFDLDTILRTEGALPAERSVGIIEQLAGAVDAAHTAGLVHRDIKPANVLVAQSATGREHVYLSDFGLARSVAQPGHTLAGQFVGSPHYAAPEQIRGDPIDRRTDVYALGEVLFACLTARAPFQAETDAAMLYAHLQSDPPAPSLVNPDVPAAFDAVVAKAMSISPDHRFDSASELAAAARTAVSGGQLSRAATIRKLVATDNVMRPSGLRKTVTVVAVGLVDESGVTSDPELIEAGLQRNTELAREVAESHGGTLEAVVGLSATIIFGVPQVHEDDALRGVRAAAAIAARVVGPVGVATGEVLTSYDRDARSTVTGDPVSAASRLEHAARPGQVLIAESTFRLVREFVTSEPTQVAIPGQAQGIAAHSFVALLEDAGRPSEEVVLVGRDDELAELVTQWHDAVTRRSPRLVTILGAAGIGKSRLAYALADAIDGRTVAGRCAAYGDGITYWPIREIVMSVVGATDADAAATVQERIAQMVATDPDGPVLAALVATAIGVGQNQAPQSDVFWAVRRLFEDLARSRPTLILIEDLERAEDTLLDLIEFVLDLASDAPALIVTTARPELLERRPGWASQRTNSDVLRLDPLPSGTALELVRAQPGGEALPDDLAQRICATADGNPLFVEEMVGALRDSPALTKVDGAWQFHGKPEIVETPPTIRALLEARIERLPADERELLERGAVVGRSFEVEGLLTLLPAVDRQTVAAHLRSLVRRELLVADRALISTGDAFRFRHILVRDVAYSSLPKADRAALHSTFARWLVHAAGERIDEQAEIVGYHLAEAYDYLVALGGQDHVADQEEDALAVEAAGYLGTAAERANARGDLKAAAKLFGRAVTLAPAAQQARSEMLVSLGGVHLAMGNFKVAREAINKALAASAKSEAVDLRATIYLLLINLQTAHADLPQTGTLEALRERVEAAGDELTTALWDMAEGAVAELEGRNAEAAISFAAALDVAQRNGLARIGGQALSRLLLNELLGTTPAAEAIARCEQVLGESSEPTVVASTNDTYALLLAMVDRTADALAAESHALRIAADLDARLDEGLYRGQTLGVIHALAGSLEQARHEAALGCEILLSLGAQAWLASAACVLGEIELALGARTEAERWLELAESLSVPSDVDARTRSAVLRARLAVLGGSDETAAKLMAEASRQIAQTELLYLQGIVAAAQACLLSAAGDADGANQRLRHAAQFHMRKGDLARARRADELAEALRDDAAAWHAVALV